MTKRFLILIAFIGIFLLLGCTAGDNPLKDSGDSAGFFMGLWHGIIVFFTLVISLFTDNITIYEVHNTGFWYDLGFFFGLTIIMKKTEYVYVKTKKRRR